MTRDDIIRMASETRRHDGQWWTSDNALERFATLVAEHEAAKWAQGAKVSIPTITMEQEFSFYYRKGYKAGVEAEREACAKVCEECGAIVDGLNPLDCAEAIRKREKG